MQTVIIIVIIIIAIILLIYFTKEGFNGKDEEYELIKTYLLNESPLYGKNKPKIWIHTTTDINARNWQSFSDRTSHELNQPYIELTVQSIIDHCASNFNILLINDETFSKLIPKWKFNNMSAIPDPQKTHIRQRALMQLLYYYGGIIVPNSFICFHNLEPLFKPTPFTVETINRTLFANGKTFAPSIEFIGVRNKRDPSIKSLMDECFPGDIPTDADKRYKDDTSNKRDWETVGGEIDITGKCKTHLTKLVKEGGWFMWDGELFGVKTVSDGKPILVEDLMEEDYLDLSPDTFGILVDSAEILRRPKYEWLASIMPDNGGTLKGVNAILAKYLNKAVIDGIIVSKKRERNVSVI